MFHLVAAAHPARGESSSVLLCTSLWHVGGQDKMRQDATNMWRRQKAQLSALILLVLILLNNPSFLEVLTSMRGSIRLAQAPTAWGLILDIIHPPGISAARSRTFLQNKLTNEKWNMTSRELVAIGSELSVRSYIICALLSPSRASVVEVP